MSGIGKVLSIATAIIIVAVLIKLGALIYIAEGFPAKGDVIDSFEKIGVSHRLGVIRPYDEKGGVELFVDDSKSMKGYVNDSYVSRIRTIKAYLTGNGSGVEIIRLSQLYGKQEEGIWGEIEKREFYDNENTKIGDVLDVIRTKIKVKETTTRGFVIITDGIESDKGSIDYSLPAKKIAEIVDSGFKFSLIAFMVPFEGKKYGERDFPVPYSGQSPIFCFVFSTSNDLALELENTLHDKYGTDVQLVEFNDWNSGVELDSVIVPKKNPDQSENDVTIEKNNKPVYALNISSNKYSSLIMKILIDRLKSKINIDRLDKKTPEYCGSFYEVEGKRTKALVPVKEKVIVAIKRNNHIEPGIMKDNIGKKDNMLIETTYEMTFDFSHIASKLIATDISFCGWVDSQVPDWVNHWSSDCDNDPGCYVGKTPYIKEIVSAILRKTMEKQTFGYLVLKK